MDFSVVWPIQRDLHDSGISEFWLGQAAPNHFTTTSLSPISVYVRVEGRTVEILCLGATLATRCLASPVICTAVGGDSDTRRRFEIDSSLSKEGPVEGGSFSGSRGSSSASVRLNTWCFGRTRRPWLTTRRLAGDLLPRVILEEPWTIVWELRTRMLVVVEAGCSTRLRPTNVEVFVGTSSEIRDSAEGMHNEVSPSTVVRVPALGRLKGEISLDRGGPSDVRIRRGALGVRRVMLNSSSDSYPSVSLWAGSSNALLLSTFMTDIAMFWDSFSWTPWPPMSLSLSSAWLGFESSCGSDNDWRKSCSPGIGGYSKVEASSGVTTAVCACLKRGVGG